ncbi:MAG: hypothetical protein QM607_04435 [Microbacterium sp.]
MDDVPAPRVKGRGPFRFTLRRDDGGQTEARLKKVALADVPLVIVDDVEYRVVPPLSALQLIWSFLPFVLIVGAAAGGMVGGALGGLGTFVGITANLRLFRLVPSTPLAWLATAGVNLAAFLYLLALLVLAHHLRN